MYPVELECRLALGLTVDQRVQPLTNLVWNAGPRELAECLRCSSQRREIGSAGSAVREMAVDTLTLPLREPVVEVIRELLSNHIVRDLGYADCRGGLRRLRCRPDLTVEKSHRKPPECAAIQVAPGVEWPGAFAAAYSSIPPFGEHGLSAS